jgi:hypothetical protein
VTTEGRRRDDARDLCKTIITGQQSEIDQIRGPRGAAWPLVGKSRELDPLKESIRARLTLRNTKQYALSDSDDCDRTVISQAWTLEEHRGLRTHIE